MNYFRYTLSILFGILFFISSYFIVEIISINQVKNDYENLSFVPDNAHFLIRVQAKEIIKEFFNEVIKSDGLGQMGPKEKDAYSFDFTCIDFTYPVYFYSVDLGNSKPKVTALALKNENSFNEQLDKYKNVVGFTHNKVGFWVTGCNLKDAEKIKKRILNSKTRRWDKLMNHEKNIAFEFKELNFKGEIDINNNIIQLTSQFKSIPTKQVSSCKILKPNGFHFLFCNPMDIIEGFNVNIPSKYLNQIKNIQAISINYYGLKPPFHPQFSLLIHSKAGFELKELIKSFNIPSTKMDGDKLSIAGLNYSVIEPQSNCILIQSNENSPFEIQNSEKYLAICGDFNRLVNLDDTPFLKFLLFNNSSSISIYNVLQSVKSLEVSISNSKKPSLQDLNLKLEVDKNKSIYGELMKLLQFAN